MFLEHVMMMYGRHPPPPPVTSLVGKTPRETNTQQTSYTLIVQHAN